MILGRVVDAASPLVKIGLRMEVEQKLSLRRWKESERRYNQVCIDGLGHRLPRAALTEQVQY